MKALVLHGLVGHSLIGRMRQTGFYFHPDGALVSVRQAQYHFYAIKTACGRRILSHFPVAQSQLVEAALSDLMNCPASNRTPWLL